MAAEPAHGDYRGGLFDQIDVPALVSLVFCAVGFILVILLMRPTEEETLAPEQRLDDLSERMARILMPLRPQGPAPKARPAPPKPKAAPSEKGREARSRIERSRQRLNQQIREVGTRVSHTAVLSILSSKGPGGRPGRRGGGGTSLGFSDLNQRLSNLDGLTRFEDRGSGSENAQTRGSDADKADAGGLFQKFDQARQGKAAKIGSFEFERPKLLGSAKQASGKQLQTLAAFINRNQTAIRLLYEERLKTNPALEGKVTVVLVIEESGKVSSARVVPEETSLQDPDFQQEILRSVRRWTFPAFKGGAVELKSPFVFKPV